MPYVVAGEIDVFAAQRREVGQKVFIDRLALFAQPMDSASQIDGVPRHDGGNDQIQPAGSVALILKASIAQLAQAVEEDRTRQGVLRFAFVQPNCTR
jgi:hypothetical protein